MIRYWEWMRRMSDSHQKTNLWKKTWINWWLNSLIPKKRNVSAYSCLTLVCEWITNKAWPSVDYTCSLSSLQFFKTQELVWSNILNSLLGFFHAWNFCICWQRPCNKIAVVDRNHLFVILLWVSNQAWISTLSAEDSLTLPTKWFVMFYPYNHHSHLTPSDSL